MRNRSDARRRTSLILGSAFALILGCWVCVVMTASRSESNLKGAALLGNQGHGFSPVATEEKEDQQAVIKLDEALSRQKLYFEPNRGQIDSQVRYVSRGLGYAFFITPEEAVFVLRKNARMVPQEKNLRDLHKQEAARAESAKVQSAVVRMRLKGANAVSVFQGEGFLQGKSNYFLGQDPQRWQTDVPHYGRIRCERVYDGVDLVYYGSQQKLEYDFEVRPGADPTRIRLDFSGVDKIEIDERGDLVLHTACDVLRQQAPIVYQEVDGRRQRVQGHYVRRDGDEIGFEVAAYDRGRTLVIDPVLVYSTFLGGTNYERAYGIAADGGGNAYVTGYTDSTDFPTAGAYQSTLKNYGDVFVTKFNASGTLQYSTYIGGSDSEYGKAIAVDGSGNAYITGQSWSSDYPTPNGYQMGYLGSGDAIVSKLNASGNALTWSTYLGGSDYDFANAIAVDANEYAYVVGHTQSATFPTANPIQATLSGYSDAFIAKLGTSGSTLVYSTFHGGSGDEYGRGVAVLPSGVACMVGETSSVDAFPLVNARQGYLKGGWDAFVSKVSADGSAYVYSTYHGGASEEWGYGVAMDKDGHAFVCGVTQSSDFPTVNPFQAAHAGGYSDGFVSRFKTDGSSLVYSTFLGGSSQEYECNSIAVDGAGNAYVTGHTNSTDFPVVEALQGTNAGGMDVFVTKLSGPGNVAFWSTYLGGTDYDYANGIASKAGNTYLCGFTNSADFPNVNACQTARNGYEDAFVVKIQGLPPPTLTAITPSSGPTTGGTAVTVTGGGFVFDTQVTFDGAPATDINVVSDTKLTCKTPAHAAGAVNVMVRNPDQQQFVKDNGFTYNAPDDTNRAPTIDASQPTSSNASPFVGDTVNFTVSATDADNDPLTYAWDFGDGTTSDAQNPSHAFSTHGTFTVTVTVSDGKTSVSKELTQIVYHPTLPNITEGPSANPNPAVVGNNVMLSAQASNAAGDTLTLTWNFGDGSATEVGPSRLHAYAAAGNYTATVTASDANGNSASASVTVEVTVEGGGGISTGEMVCAKVKLKLNFKQSGKDMVSVQGTMTIPEGFNPDGAIVDVDISGVYGSFRLDAKGKASADINEDKNKKFMLSLKIKGGVIQAGETKFSLAFKNGDFKDTWRRFGLENEDITEREVSVPITVTTESVMYPDYLDGSYRAYKDKSGQYIGKEGLSLGGF